jgi:hypothetical protein
MSLSSVSLSFGCTIGGAFLATKGIKNCYQGQTKLGMTQVLLGAIGMAGGVYSLMHQQTAPKNYGTFQYYGSASEYQHDRSACTSSTLDQIQKACENVLSKGYESIPSMDLTKHISSIGPNFADGKAYPRCDVELTREGHVLFDQLGLGNWKHIFKAVLPNGCPVHGVIRHY